MAEEAPVDRERRRIKEAEDRAREETRVEAWLRQHDRQFEIVGNAVAEGTRERAALKQQITDLKASFQQSLALAEQRAAAVEKAAKEQATTRQLYVAAAGVTVALVSALAASGTFG